MTRGSIRSRLTAWYLAVIGLAMITLAAGSWWLFRQATIAAADASLRSRIDSVTSYIRGMAHDYDPTALQEELGEYGELSAGETLLEVADDSGRVVLTPTMTGWADVRSAATPSGDAVILVNRTSVGRPFRVAVTSRLIEGRRYRIVAAMPMSSADAAWRHFGWLMAVLLPLVGVVAAAGGYWISGRALAPVDQMTRSVQAISLHNLDRRLDVPRADDELRRLATTFNEMFGRLESSVAEMVRFTAEASHELRTPVAVVRSTAELTLAKPRTAEEYRDALGDVLVQAERMSVLVADLLSLARSDAGVEPRERAAVDLRVVAEAAARDVQDGLTARELAFDLELPARAEVMGAAESLRRLVLILLDNAIKYTPRGGRIALRVAVDDAGGRAAGCVIAVRDTGCGIDPAEQPFIFDRFYRGAAARHQADGSGLGLSLARTIVERHDGTIAIYSDGPGLGSLAHVRIPATISDPTAPL